jgi:hypothetical protein
MGDRGATRPIRLGIARTQRREPLDRVERRLAGCGKFFFVTSQHRPFVSHLG